MIIALDVGYHPGVVLSAAIAFHAWTDARPALEHSWRLDEQPAPYAPGEFYRRELPYLLGVLDRLAVAPTTLVVDGYAWLGPGRPGLGAHLHAARHVPVVGVAKTPFRGAGAEPLLRGASRRPLHVSAAGLDPAVAVALVASMHGPHRIPTLLRRVDQLARTLA